MQMKREELADMIYKTLYVFDFLQFVDEGYETNDFRARNLVDAFFEQRRGNGPDIRSWFLPLAQLKTTLSVLMITVCFANSIEEREWDGVGFSIMQEYDVAYFLNEVQNLNPKVGEVLKTVRNACAHLPDCVVNGKEQVNVPFDNGCVTFFSMRPNSQVSFLTQNGFVAFLRDYLRAIKKQVHSRLLTTVN